MTDKEWAIHLIRTLNISSSDNDTYDLHCRMIDSLHCHPGDFSVRDGASKMCIVPKGKPFVIKWNSDGEEEAEEEVRIYKKAVSTGLEMFFPKTEVLFTYNGIVFVFQEKVSHSVCHMEHKEIELWKKIGRTVKDQFSDRMEKEFQKASIEYQRDLSPLWAKAVISLYGKRMAKRLCQFIIENGINDLHENNIGIKDGKPVILDFSGYYRFGY